MDGVAIFILTSRCDSMIRHLQDYLKHHKIKVDGVVHTSNQSKTGALKKIKANVLVEDVPFKIEQIFEEDSEFSKKCCFILYRNIQNKIESKPYDNVMEVDNWDDLCRLITKLKSELMGR